MAASPPDGSADGQSDGVPADGESDGVPVDGDSDGDPADGESDRAPSIRDQVAAVSLRDRIEDAIPVEVTLTRVVLAITVVALLARIVLLGARTVHWDEARVAYWTNYYAETGNFAYRHIIHGPFAQHAGAWMIRLFGPSDFVIRLPVAVIGGLLPLGALLFREHLRDEETVILALLLAFNAVFLYFSRFMRSDVLVGAFMLVGFGFLVRFYDTRRWWYLYGFAAFTALGFASKENAIIYVLNWLGATALLVDHALFRPRDDESGLALLRRTRLGRVGGATRRLQTLPARLAAADPVGVRTALDDPDSRLRRTLRYLLHPAGILAVFGLVLLFMYAPRGAGRAGYDVATQGGGNVTGFWEGITNPLHFPAMVGDTADSTIEEMLRWGQTGGGAIGGERDLVSWYGQQVANDHREILVFVQGEYVDWLGGYAKVLAFTSPVILVGGLLGFLYERFAVARSRNLVMFMGYIGIVSIIGYPLAGDVFGPWLAVHMLLPLTIPAAAFLGAVYRFGMDVSVSQGTLRYGASVFVLVLAAGLVAFAGVTSVYTNTQSDDNQLVQWAQPGDNIGPAIDDMRRIASEHESGADVLVYYGGGTGESRFISTRALVKNESQWAPSGMDYRPHCTVWFNALPMPWYFETTGSEVTCARTAGDLESAVVEEEVPFIMTDETDTSVPRDLLQRHYTGRTYQLRAWGQEVTFWVHDDWAA